MTEVKEYEVTIAILHKKTKGLRELTVTEYAYGVQDAILQTVYNVHNVIDPSKEEFKEVVKVSPPARMVDIARKEMDAAVDHMMRELVNRLKDVTR